VIRKSSETIEEIREGMRGGDGLVIVRHLFRKEEFKANVRLCARLLLPPGASIGEHTHEAEDEVYIVIHGTGLLRDGSKETRVSPGDAILTGRGQSHAIRNDGTHDLELIAMIMCYA
jgi:mannose-6-phosphate isomerase-like protein (cupin superfamily)